MSQVRGEVTSDCRVTGRQTAASHAPPSSTPGTKSFLKSHLQQQVRMAAPCGLQMLALPQVDRGGSLSCHPRHPMVQWETGWGVPPQVHLKGVFGVDASHP